MSKGPINPGREGEEELSAVFGFEDDAWVCLMRDAAAPEGLGTVAGYRVLADVGRGAQGAVFRAEHLRNGRVVALKRPAAGVLTGAEARERFLREVETAAILHHPNVVGFQGIEFVDGQPLLVMEWIDGLPADRWAADEPGKLRDIRTTLETFARICDAVSYAHQRGVIHRDLKPSNILIDAAGEPHVLDFGLARVRPGLGPEMSRLTRTEGFAGTPAYAPPEQLAAGAHDADVRGDVYALGVVLYEMLTGRRPFAEETDWERLLLAIRHEHPAPPSRHRTGLGVELDAIVLRAIAKEPERRYQSVHALGADVRRLLAGEPVDAKRDSTWYVLRKLLRRHRGPIAAATIAFLLMTCGAVVSTALWQRAERQSRLARDEVKKAELTAGFLVNMLRSIDPEAVDANDPSVRRLLDSAMVRVRDGELAGTPDVEIHVRLELGHAYRMIGAHGSAEEALRPALELAERVHGSTHLEVAWVLHELGHVLADSYALRSALDMYQGALDVLDRLGVGDHQHRAEYLKDIAWCLTSMDRASEALPRAQEAVAIAHRLQDDDDPLTAGTLEALADCLTSLGRSSEALRGYEQVLAIRQRLDPPDHPGVATSLNNLAGCLWRGHDRASDALPLYEEALAIRQRTLNGDHPLLLTNLGNVAGCLQAMSRHGEALGYFEQALAMAQRLYEGDHGSVSLLLHHVAEARRYSGGDLLMAEHEARSAVAMYQRHPEWDLSERRHAMQVLSEVLKVRGHLEDLLNVQMEEATLLRQAATGSVELAAALASIGMQLLESAYYDQAGTILRECLDIRERKLAHDSADYWFVPHTRSLLGGALVGQASLLHEAEGQRVHELLSEAEPLVVDSYGWLSAHPDRISRALPMALRRDRMRQAAERVVKLYEVWDAVEPGKGYAQKAAEWRQELDRHAQTTSTERGPSP